MEFLWQRHPKAEKIILTAIQECVSKSAFIAEIEHHLFKLTSTRLLDFTDHVVLGQAPVLLNDLEESGFVVESAEPDYRIFHHPGAQLPRVVVRDQDHPVFGLALKVESIAEFLSVRGLQAWIEGTPFSPYRRALVHTENSISLWAVERRSGGSMEPIYEDVSAIDKYIEAKELWMTRPRQLEDEEIAMKEALQLAKQIVSILGRDKAAWVILECERQYWQARNLAAQMQKNRQDALGMGWANHDHHTFRSSRRFFPQLVRLFEILSFHCRERFYAGKEAGWGAQVMEQSQAGLVLFLDLDLTPEEVQIDFAHKEIPETEQLGTVGLWCELHGDSILKAGMHHLEAQFVFDALREDLQHLGVSMMDPFSNFDYLKQAFTHGQVWPVDPKRVEKLLQAGKISSQDADKFIKYGAVGSHMENLQRTEGYKGFNQKNVSWIIEKTDPRKIGQTTK